MQVAMRVAGLSFACCFSAAVSEKGSNPMATVISLVDDLTAKIEKDGEAQQKAYNEYVEWCDETAKNAGFAIETATKEKAKLDAKIGKFSGDIQAGEDKIEELGASISADEAELKDAATIRKKEVADFASSEGELMDSIDALGRAIGILEKEMTKNPASFAQVDTRNINAVAQALSVVLEAAAFPSKDQTRLVAFVQAQQGDEEDDVGAPAGDVYKTHSSNILDVLAEMKEKAESQLAELRKAETNTKHNFEMLKQSLEDQMEADTKDMNDEKASNEAAAEAKAKAEGDLDMTEKDLASSKNQLATAQSTCINVAADHEASVASRKEELQVMAKAKEILVETSSGAVSQTYSLVQLTEGARITTRASLVNSEIIVMVKSLAMRHKSAALAQLASRISTVLRFGGADPFKKVKGLIEDMIAKLEKQAGEEAEEKAFCDEQMAKTEAKKSELEEDVSKQTSRIDQAAADSAQLKEEIKVLQAELAALAKEQAEMDKIRQEERADFQQAKADLELGLSGVRKALSVLREYYEGASMLQDDAKFGAMLQQPAKPETFKKASGAGGGIIDILEVCESDFATNLAKEEQEESDAQADYEKVSQENAVTKTTKDQDLLYKGKEAKARDATVAMYTADRKTTNKELSAVLAYYGELKDRCIGKPETYEVRKARREAEIEGLKKALSTLEDETALVQRRKRGSFRGTLAA